MLKQAGSALAGKEISALFEGPAKSVSLADSFGKEHALELYCVPLAKARGRHMCEGQGLLA
jgi:hypothetical protein